MLHFFTKKDSRTIKAKYNIPDEIKLNYQVKDGWFLISSPDLPGLVTQARTAKELLEMVNDAILTYYDVPKKEAKEVFDMIKLDGHGVILSKKAARSLATS